MQLGRASIAPWCLMTIFLRFPSTGAQWPQEQQPQFVAFQQPLQSVIPSDPIASNTAVNNVGRFYSNFSVLCFLTSGIPCGQPMYPPNLPRLRTKIAGGVRANPNSFPWMASLEVTGAFNFPSIFSLSSAPAAARSSTNAGFSRRRIASEYFIMILYNLFCSNATSPTATVTLGAHDFNAVEPSRVENRVFFIHFRFRSRTASPAGWCTRNTAACRVCPTTSRCWSWRIRCSLVTKSDPSACRKP